MLVAKRKHAHKTLKEKCQALKDLESSSLSKSEVAAKYGIPRNTLSTWIKNKQKILSALEQGSNPKRQKLRHADHENLDKAVLTYTKSKYSDFCITNSRESSSILNHSWN